MARRIHRSLAGSALALLLLLPAAPALAHPHDSSESGHPLRIAAYLVHPFGVLLDTLIMRPAHWVVSREPMSTIFGHEDE
jgi:hypothetical protein